MNYAKVSCLESDIGSGVTLRASNRLEPFMLRDKQHSTRKLSAVEKDIDAAIQRVHDAYGTDLPAFFKKVQSELQRPAQQPLQPTKSDKETQADR